MEPSVSGGDDVIGVGFPDEGFWVGGIVFADEAVDGGLQVDEGMEDAMLEPAPGEFGEEALDGIEPRARGRREMEGPARMALEPGADFVLLVRRVVVEDDVDGLVCRHLALDAVEEADELLMAVALHVLADDRAVENVERGKQRRRAVAFVIMGHGAGAALLHGQAGLGAVERLDLALLVDRQHHRMGRRIDIEADDIRELLGKGRVVRQLEAAPAVRAEAVDLPDRLHRRWGNAGRLGHRAQRPVGRLVRRRGERQANDLGDPPGRHRRLARRTGLVAKQTLDAVVHEPLLPAPHAGLGLAGLGHDRRGPETLVALEDDPRPPDMFLRAFGVRDDRLQSLTIAGRDGKMDAGAHSPDSHDTAQNGIPYRTLSFRSIH